tara:strand:+ start:285 stop:875 length:591 start_codon:yes stop_codon:yes gene_type:complete
MRVLHVDSSCRDAGSVSREVSEALVSRFQTAGYDVVRRDLGLAPPSVIDAVWIKANFTPEDKRTEEQKTKLHESDTLVSELQSCDVIVIGAPVYNFTIAAVLKLWVDQITRVGLAFKYTPDGPVGLIDDEKKKKVIVIFSSGGTAMGAANDFHSEYVRYILGFIGLTNVTFIDAGRVLKDMEAKSKALETVEAMEL